MKIISELCQNHNGNLDTLESMVKSAAKNNFIDERKVVFETLMSFKRAGANAILTYYAKQIIDWLK